MKKNFNSNIKQPKNSNDRFYEIYRYFESISHKAHLGALDYTIKTWFQKKRLRPFLFILP